MFDSQNKEVEYKALNDFVVNSTELDALEAKLGDFNLFDVLGVAYAELKHSNTLAWLFNPEESHGLGSIFLQRWLMRVLHASEKSPPAVTPVEIDAWNLIRVEVRREWQHIDLLLILTLEGGAQWIVSIENKVQALQSKGQLQKYREAVQSEFAFAERKIYIFLTKNGEIPEDDTYLTASYEDIYYTLSETRHMRRHSIGHEPSVLIENYLRLLEERFMNDSDIAKLAVTIYRKHQRAIDLIFEYIPNNAKQIHLTELACQLEAKKGSLDISMGPINKAYVRFIPKKWDIPENRMGVAWGDSNIGVLFEVECTPRGVAFMIVAGKPPQSWMDSLPSDFSKPPFKLDTKYRTKSYPRLYGEYINNYDPSKIYDPDEAGVILYNWIKKRLNEDDMKEVIRLVQQQIKRIPEYIDELIP